MPKLREYVESSEKSGYYINENYENKYITYQTLDFAESVLLNLGYGDHDSIPYEVFYILLNLDLIYTGQSGVKPVDSLEELPEFENDETSQLSPEQRTRLLDMLREYEDIDQQQRGELDEYADSKKTITQNEDSSITLKEALNTHTSNEQEADDESGGSNGRNDDRTEKYDNYWIRVDLARFLGEILKQSDATTKDVDNSPLVKEYKRHKDKKDELSKECEPLSGSLPKYKDAVGMKDERQVMTKTSLEESGIKISNGGSDFVAHFDFEPYHDDIALPDGYEIPNVWSDSERSTLEDVTIDDIPDETRKKLLREARAEVIDDILEAEEGYKSQIDNARSEFVEYLKTERDEH